MNARYDAPALAAALFTVTCWSLNFPIIRYALPAYDPLRIALLRLIFASAALALYAAWRRLPLPALRDVPAFLGFGLSGLALSSILLASGLQWVTAGAGAFLVGTIPVFAALLARTFLRERLGATSWAAIAVSFSGVALIGLGESGGGGTFSPGALLLTGSALCQSVFYVFQKPYLRRYRPDQVTCYAVWSGTLFMLVFLPGLPGLVRAAPLGATLATAYLGIFPIAGAFVAWSYALSRARAARVTSAMYAMPALSIVEAWLWLGEFPAALSIFGGTVALSGVAILNVWGR